MTTPSPGIFTLLHAEVLAPVQHELVDLGEGVLVQEDLDPLPGGEAAGLVLLVDLVLAAAQFGLLGAELEELELVFLFLGHGASWGNAR